MCPLSWSSSARPVTDLTSIHRSGIPGAQLSGCCRTVCVIFAQEKPPAGRGARESHRAPDRSHRRRVNSGDHSERDGSSLVGRQPVVLIRWMRRSLTRAYEKDELDGLVALLTEDDTLSMPRFAF